MTHMCKNTSSRGMGGDRGTMRALKWRDGGHGMKGRISMTYNDKGHGVACDSSTTRCGGEGGGGMEAA